MKFKNFIKDYIFIIIFVVVGISLMLYNMLSNYNNNKETTSKLIEFCNDYQMTYTSVYNDERDYCLDINNKVIINSYKIIEDYRGDYYLKLKNGE